MSSAQPGRRRAAWRAALALAAALAPGWALAQMLASIPVEPASAQAPPPSADAPSLRVRVHVVDAPGLARLLGQAVTQGGGAGSLDLSLRPGEHPDVGAPADALAPSFIVDFDDPAVVPLSRQLAGEQGQAPVDGAKVVAFVAKSMHEHYAAHASLASEVARTLQGDCTEHSLLTAALARSMKIPARIVQGAALVYADGRWQAYGHAWVQTHEAGRWTVRDSALADWPGPVYYLPAFVLADEGPGYQLGMMQGLGRLPSRIEILAPGGAASSAR